MKTIKIHVLYGVVDSKNNWSPNPWLLLTTEQQIEENRKGGHIITCKNGVYKWHKPRPHIVKRDGLWELYDNRQAALDAEWPIARCRKLESCYHILKDFNKRPNYV